MRFQGNIYGSFLSSDVIIIIYIYILRVHEGNDFLDV